MELQPPCKKLPAPVSYGLSSGLQFPNPGRAVFQAKASIVPARRPNSASRNNARLTSLRKTYSDKLFVERLMLSCSHGNPENQQVLGIAEIEDGNINLAFRIRCTSASFFLKHFLPFSKSNPGLNVASYKKNLGLKEAKIMELLSSYHENDVVIPLAFGYSLSPSMLLAQYLDGFEPLFFAEHGNLAGLSSTIGAYLRLFHGIPEIENLRLGSRSGGTFEFFARHYCQEAGHFQALARIDEWEKDYPLIKKVLTHGDFSPKNILAKGTRPALIDFQNVMYDDQARDIGQFLGDMVAAWIKRAIPLGFLIGSFESFWCSYLNGGKFDGADFLTRRSQVLAGMVLLYRSLEPYPYLPKLHNPDFSRLSGVIGRDLILHDYSIANILSKYSDNLP